MKKIKKNKSIKNRTKFKRRKSRKINQLKKEINENKNKINLFLDVKNIFNKNEINNEK